MRGRGGRESGKEERGQVRGRERRMDRVKGVGGGGRKMTKGKEMLVCIALPCPKSVSLVPPPTLPSQGSL